MERTTRGWTATWLAEARGERRVRWTLPLRPFGTIVSWFVGRRWARYDRGDGVLRPALPTVSVGNLTVGGTNKTPTVDWLLGCLARDGRTLGVATRGYGRTGPPRTFRGADLEPDPERVREAGSLGDEPRLLATRHPWTWIALDPDRIRGVAALAARGADLVVADDAFQHRRLGRVFDLVLVDVTCPWGNGRLLPAGILREPIDGLARADAVLLTRTHEATAEQVGSVCREVERWVPGGRIHRARLERLGWAPAGSGEGCLALPPGRRAFVVTGIARPGSLVHTVRSDGIEVCGARVFRDHQRIGRERFLEVETEARRAGADLLVCSEKDLANLPEDLSGGMPRWYPRVGMSIEGASELLGRIERALVEG